MSEELVEALAKRLAEKFQPRDWGPLPLTNWASVDVIVGGHGPRVTFGDLARECIRQMEWSRSNCVRSVDSFDAGNSWLDNLPLSLAPPGWEP